MKVEIEGKTLYHIQNRNIGSDGYPLDAFVWSDHKLTDEDLKKVLLKEYEQYEDYENAVEEWLTSSEIYPVWAETV